MSPQAEQVERELLALGFRTYPRGLANGLAFASITALFMWPRFPHVFLAAWLAVFVVLQLTRLAIARAFLRASPPASSFPRWTRLAALGYGAVGLAWGVLGAAAIHFALEDRVFVLWIG